MYKFEGTLVTSIVGSRMPAMHMTRMLAWICLGAIGLHTQWATAGQYVVVVSNETHGNAQWKAVCDALIEKHDGRLVTFDGDPQSVQPQLSDGSPEFVCIVAQASDVSREFVANVHQLCRSLDEDPYYDCIWGIVTGYDASDALRIAQCREPLTVRRVGSGTEIELDLCEEGEWYCELVQGKHVVKKRDGDVQDLSGPDDTTAALAGLLTDYKADLFVTSGHATERNWQIGFRYRNGYFVSEAGQMFGRDTQGQTFPIRSDHTRVYLPVGNCLMGHVDGPDAMALAWMHSLGVNQMIGYTVPTWYGYAGWGMLDYFVEQPGRFTFAEAFYINQQALMHRLTTFFPEVANLESEPGQMRGVNVTCGESARLAGMKEVDGKGLLFDRDVVAFYGDPGWEARMADGPQHWEQTLKREGNRYTLEIKPLRGDKSFSTINANGAQRGGRPIVHRLPDRIAGADIVSGKEHQPFIADDFILIPRPTEPVKDTIRVVFETHRESAK